MAILADLKDPRIQGVTVTYVEVSPDMRYAKVHVSIMGDQVQQDLSLHGLRSAAGYLQKKVGARIDTRYTPRIQFEIDMGVKRSIDITKILQNVLPDEPPPSGDEPEEGSESGAAPHGLAGPGLADDEDQTE